MFRKHYCPKNRFSTTLLISALLAALLISSIMSPSAFSVQPPIDTSTYYVGTIGQPARLDPARAYDTTSGELLQNVYETLIWWNDKHPVTFVPGVGYNLTTADYSDLDSYAPVLCTEVPTRANGRITDTIEGGTLWRFTIDTTVKFQNWTDSIGVVRPARFIAAADVVYSFRRQLVYESPYGPTWMWMTPAFGSVSWSSTYGGAYDTYSNGTFKHVADEITAGNYITNWCYSIGNDVYFHFQLPWAEGVLKQIFAQTWGGVVDPDWVKEMGGWDGLFTTGVSDNDMSAGWTNNYHWKPTSTRSELDTYKSPAFYGAKGSKYTSYARTMCGSGPYKLTSWDTTQKIWRIDYDVYYWMGWANAGNKMGNFLRTVIWKEVDYWPTRVVLFLEGELDICAVPRSNMYDLLVSTYNPIPGVNLVYNIATLSNEAMLFNMNISSASPYQAYIGYSTHIGSAQPYFFNNTHVRTAFAWALNYTAYLGDAWVGEALLQRSWWVDGLSPASYKNTNASMPQRNLDYTEMQNELNQVIIDGNNVSQTGFDVTLVYSTGNDRTMIACNLFAQAFQALNPNYHVNVVGLNFQEYLDAMSNRYLPAFAVGLSASFADPDNFCEPYQASWHMQGPPFPEDQDFVDEEIRNAMVEPNFVIRGAIYKDLQYRYWLDVASFPLVQPVGRRFARDWVQGWYFNVLLPGEYAYDLYKSIVSNPSIDVGVTGIQNIVTPPYSAVYVYDGQMRVGNGNTSQLDLRYRVTVQYFFGGAAPNLLIVVALKITNQSNMYRCYPSYATHVLSPGQTYTTELIWSGATPITAGNWTVGAEVYPTNGIDSNLANNYLAHGIVRTVSCREDLTGDGRVDIHDSIHLMGPFGRTGPPGWIPEDLMPDGIIDMFDALMLDRRFNWASANPDTPPNPETWPLKIQAFYANFTVEVYSDYIVYSNTYSFNDVLKQFSFDVTTEIDAFCNVKIPRALMSGNFTVYLDGAPTPFEVSTNVTHYFIYFTSTGLRHRVTIESTKVGLPGDANGDGWVNIFDAILLSNAYGSVLGDSNWNVKVDLNKDGTVNILDAIILASHFNEHN